MGLVRGQTEGEGMVIEGGGYHITLTILNMVTGRTNIAVTFKIEGIEGLDTLKISYNDGLVKLVDGVEIRVRSRGTFASVVVDYNVPEGYELKRQEYPTFRQAVWEEFDRWMPKK